MATAAQIEANRRNACMSRCQSVRTRELLRTLDVLLKIRKAALGPANGGEPMASGECCMEDAMKEPRSHREVDTSTPKESRMPQKAPKEPNCESTQGSLDNGVESFQAAVEGANKAKAGAYGQWREKLGSRLERRFLQSTGKFSKTLSEAPSTSI